MAFFDFMENFFFISLGITFMLILLLVYHFKQRISSVERRGDTMFELLTNVVKELQFMKNLNSYYESIFQKPAQPEIDVCLFRPPVPQAMNDETKVIDLSPTITPDILVSKIPVSDDSQSEWSDSDTEPGSELEEPTDSDDESEDSAEGGDAIEVEDLSTKDLSTIEVEDLSTKDLSAIEVEDLSTKDLSTKDLLVQDVSAIENQDVYSVEIPTLGAETEFAEPSREQKREIYRKMNITQLRGMAVSAGIGGDMTKLKKADIIKLLENLDE